MPEEMEMIKRKHLQLNNCEIKFASGESSGIFTGYGSTFGGVDSYGDTIVAGAYKNVIDAIGRGEARMPKMFLNHRSWELPIGKWVKLAEDDVGLLIDGELTPNNPESEMVKAALQHETIDGLSIGYRLSPDDVEYIEKPDGYVRLIKNISELAEVSVVTFPADDSARVDLASVKSALEEITTLKDFEDFLREAGGFSKRLATASASRLKRIMDRSDSETLEVPEELQRLIAANLKSARNL
jgi:HK97 family phage prohead protease